MFGERYRVERELGRGGMATVYLCVDTKFDRQVAIKLLHPELTAAVGADRFHREIKIATGLTHPNILPAHDSGEADGSLYYVMPFVAGESLRARIDRERQLPVQDAVRITAEIASALQYAHSHGIVHRDIKPENILLESEHAVLADFGIARAVTSAADVEALTKTGMSLGTPGYMSPEQALGEKNIDGRSDQYSLACVAYEMLTGQPPFVASTMQALVAKHLGEPVPLISTVRPSVPDELEDVILRALEKVPADRFQSCGEFGEALLNVVATTGTWARRSQQLRTVEGRLRTTRTNRAIPQPVTSRRHVTAAVTGLALILAGASVALASKWLGSAHGNGIQQDGSAVGRLDPRTIAIPYFEDLSRDSSLADLAAGLTEGLIEELSRVRALNVISRSGVAPYRNTEVARDSIARALQAGSLIVGSVEPQGGQVRVTARLVEGLSGSDVKRKTFELPAGQLLVARDSLVKEVATLLRQHLGDEVRLQERRAGTSNVNAWTLVQRAERLRKDAEVATKESRQEPAMLALAQADSILVEAEKADERWAEPTLARGWIALQRAQLEPEPSAVGAVEAAVNHADRVLGRIPNHPEALALRGTARFRRWELRGTMDSRSLSALLERARQDLEAAVTADPAQARANVTLSHLYYNTDDVPGALLAARRAYEEDAYLEDAERILMRLFWGSLDLEQFNEARRWCAEGARRFSRDRRFMQCQLWLMVTPAVPAQANHAWALLASLDSATPTQQRAYAGAEGRILVAGALARAGLADSARRVIERTKAGVSAEIDAHQNLLAREAYVRTLMGDQDIAIDLLKRYVAANPGHGFAEQAGTVWWWRNLRSYRRWSEVAQPNR